MSKGATGPTVPVPWNKLRAWIDAHESQEQQGNSTLCRPQLAALSHLVEFIEEEPDVSDSDYVSRLMHFAQIKNLQSPIFKDLEPIDVPVGGAFSNRWRTACILPSSNKQFPCTGYGLEAGQVPPMFKSKKMAKQYAAKQALAYLSRESTSSPSAQASPSSGGAPLSTIFAPFAKIPAPGGSDEHARQSPTAFGPATNPAASNNHETKASPSDAPDPVTSSPGPGERSNSEFDSDEGATVFARINTLSGRMGLESPAILVEPEGENGMYSGRALFRNGGRIPPHIGIVTGVYGKKEAKKLVAEQVLAWFVEENKRRQKVTDELLEGLP